MKQVITVFISTLLMLSDNVSGQGFAKTNEISQYFDKLPAVAGNANEAYTQYYPKGKVSAAKQYEEIITGQLNLMADLSEHKSRLLSMLAGMERYEKEDRQYNFIKAEEANKKDKDLDIKFREINSAMIWELKEFNRMIGPPVDSIMKLNLGGIPRTNLQLQVYQRTVPGLINRMKKHAQEVTALLEKKGYNKVLDNHDADHPYYIQALEMRGLIFDRIRMITQIIEGINAMAAQMVDICTKNPDACK